ncbi:MAG: hypothetical protein AB8B74_04030 [Crocinitomicaceae bacterium]
MKNLIFPAQGTLTFSWSKSIWFYCMLIPCFFIEFSDISTKTIVTAGLFTFISVCLGHSVGLHRGVIHKAYQTSILTRNVLVYIFTLTGLGSPITWLKLHFYRDYWQNRVDCPRYFAYQHSIFKDFYWYLHLSFKTDENDRYELPEDILNGSWFK